MMARPVASWIESTAQHSRSLDRQMLFLSPLLQSQLTDTEQFVGGFIPTAAKLFRDGMFVPTPLHRLFNRTGKSSRIPWSNQNPALVIDEFQDSSNIRRNHRASATQSFDDYVGISLVVAGQS